MPGDLQVGGNAISYEMTTITIRQLLAKATDTSTFKCNNKVLSDSSCNTVTEDDHTGNWQ